MGAVKPKERTEICVNFAVVAVNGGTYNHDPFDELRLLDLGAQRITSMKLGAAKPVAALQGRPPPRRGFSCNWLRWSLCNHNYLPIHSPTMPTRHPQ